MTGVKLREFDTTLIIKAPNQKISDQTIKCESQWTVKRLKQYLSEVYPSQPNENQQRIIYSGRLLHDDLTLKEILKHGVDVHTVHLVCPSEKTSSDQKFSPPDSRSNSSQPLSQPGPSAASSLSEEELHALYREYYTYVYQWYQQQMFQYFSNPRTESPTQVQPSVLQPSNSPQEPAGGNGARAGAPPPAAPAAAPAIAAGPGAIGGEFDDENFERDWLDWFYYALRVAILIGLLNYYSSWSKILTAIGVIGVFTLYRYVFQRRNAAAEPEQPAQRQQQPQQEVRQAQGNSGEAGRPADTPTGNEAREAGASNATEAPTEPIIEVQESIFRKIVNSFYLFSQFFVTLITSLVPERVPPLDLD